MNINNTMTCLFLCLLTVSTSSSPFLLGAAAGFSRSSRTPIDFYSGTIAGYVGSKISRSLVAAFHSKADIKNQICKADNPFTTSEQLKYETMCFPEDEPQRIKFISILVGMYFTIFLIGYIITIMYTGTQSDKEFLIGQIIGSIVAY